MTDWMAEKVMRRERLKFPGYYDYRDLMDRLRETYEPSLTDCSVCGGKAILIDNMKVRVEYGPRGNTTRKDVLGDDEVWVLCKGCERTGESYTYTKDEGSKEAAVRQAVDAWNSAQGGGS